MKIINLLPPKIPIREPRSLEVVMSPITPAPTKHEISWIGDTEVDNAELTNRDSCSRTCSLNCTKHHQVSEIAAKRKPSVGSKIDKKRASGGIIVIPRNVRDCWPMNVTLFPIVSDNGPQSDGAIPWTTIYIVMVRLRSDKLTWRS